MKNLLSRFARLIAGGLILSLVIACSGGAQPATPAPIPTTAASNQPAASQTGAYPAPQTGAYPAPPQEGVGGAAQAAYPPPNQAVSGKQAVTFTTSDQVTLAGAYYIPAHPRSPGVVLVHMVDGRQSDWDTLANLLQKEGFAVLTFDLRGHGKSSGDREWGKMADDVTVAYRFLSGQPEVDPARIALVGASIGANLALNVAASEPAVKSLVLLSPGLDYRGVKTEAAMKAYGARPALFIASKTDTYAAQSVETLAKLVQGKKKQQIYDNAGHGTQMLGQAGGLEDLILNWLRETLGQTPE